MNIKNKVYVLILVFISILIFDYLSMEYVKNETRQTNDSVLNVEQFNTHLQTLQKIEVEFLFEPSTQFAQAYHQQSEVFLREVDSLQNLLDWAPESDQKAAGLLTNSIRLHAQHFSALVDSLARNDWQLTSDYKSVRQNLFDEAENISRGIDAFESELRIHLTEKLNRLSNTIYVISFVIVLLAILLIWFGANGLVKSVQRLSLAFTELRSTMDFSSRIEVTSKDEIGQVSEQYNQVLGVLENSIDQAILVVDKLAHGELNERMNGSYSGDLEKLQQGINDSAQKIHCAMDELEDVIRKISEGDFSYQSEERLPGVYGDVVSHASLTVERFNTVFEELNTVMQEVANGFFSNRITSEVHGELSELKDNINHSLNNLQKAIYETAEVMIAQGNRRFNSSRERVL